MNGGRPLPRFYPLPAPQRAAILEAALSEFAAFGYVGASLNRIIAEAGMSKGAMYYYFDGKQDLYAQVIRDGLEQLLAADGGAPVPAATDPNGFWQSLEQQYLHLMDRLLASPRLAGLLRDWLGGSGAPALDAAQHDAKREALPWLNRTIVMGQSCGAVRTDLPSELLIALALGMGQAVDTWLLTRPAGATELEAAVHTLLDTMRRAFQP